LNYGLSKITQSVCIPETYARHPKFLNEIDRVKSSRVEAKPNLARLGSAQWISKSSLSWAEFWSTNPWPSQPRGLAEQARLFYSPSQNMGTNGWRERRL